jgi:hypothetical protein
MPKNSNKNLNKIDVNQTSHSSLKSGGLSPTRLRRGSKDLTIEQKPLLKQSGFYYEVREDTIAHNRAGYNQALGVAKETVNKLLRKYPGSRGGGEIMSAGNSSESLDILQSAVRIATMEFMQE